MLRRPVSARDFHQNSASTAQRPTWDSPPIDAEFARALGTPSHGQSTAAHGLTYCPSQQAQSFSIETRRAPHNARRAHSRPIDAKFAHALSERHPPRTIDRRAQPVMLRRPVSARDFHQNLASAAQRPTWDSSPIDAEFAHTLETPSPANNRPPRTACHAAQTGQCEGFPSKLGERRTAPDARIRGQSTRDSHAPSKRHPPRTIDRRA